jgi:RNA polymerase sigma-70 factor (ECF subfamily)
MSPSTGKIPEFERLYREYGGLAYVMAMRILGDRQLAEDATQESWVRIAREIDRGVAPRFEQSFVITIARNEALRIATRRGHPLLRAEPFAPPVPDPIEAREERRLLRQAMNKLPEDDRQLLEMQYIDQVSPKDLRKRFGVNSRNAIWKRIQTAKERLRKAFRQP